MVHINNLLRSLSLSRRLALGFVVLILILGSFGIWAYQSVAEIAVNGPVFKRFASNLDLKASVIPPDLYIVEPYAAVLELERANDTVEQQAIVSRLKMLQSRFDASQAYWRQQVLDPRINKLLMVKAQASGLAFFDTAYTKLIPAVLARDRPQVQRAMAELTSHYTEHRQFIGEVVVILDQIQREDTEFARAIMQRLGLAFALITALTLALLFVLGWLLRNSMTTPLDRALSIAMQVAKGDLDVQEPEHFQDEPGRLVSALVDMSHKMHDSVHRLEHANFINNQAMEISRAGAWSIDFGLGAEGSEMMHLSSRAQVILGEAPRVDDLYEWRSIWASLMASGEKEVTQRTAAALYACKSGASAGFDVVYAYRRPADGGVVWIRSIGRVESAEAGTSSHMVGVLMDVTEARKAEAALQEAHLVLKTALEMAKAGIWRINLVNHSDQTYLSEAAATIYGCDTDKGWISEKVWLDAVRGNDRLSGIDARQMFGQAIRSGSDVYEAIYAYRRPLDGREVWLHDRASIQRDADGKAREVFGVVVDVTDVYKTQEVIEHANDTLEQALELSRAGTWSRDFAKDAKRIQFAPRALRLLGFKERADGMVTVDEMNARTLAAAGADAAAELAQQVAELFGGTADDYELRYPFRRELDGGTVWVHDIGTVKRGAGGEIISMHGVLRDITRERQAEEAIMAAMEEAEAASRSKGDFLANMSHEIRTPMNAIIGLSGLALKNEMPPRIRDYLAKIKQSGEHLLGIINDILDFSKIESGKLDIEAVEFELEAVIANVVNLLSDKIDAKGLELICKVDADIPKVLVGDPLRIGQILINLANNALKFTQQGEIGLRISIREVQDGLTVLLFSVSDTGIGLAPEQMGRLFQSFAQADSSITRKFGGTGLGLSISKSLAQAMGGEIGVDSVLGEGSTFWFTVRLGVGSTERMLPGLSMDLHGSRVLVVDDNEAAALVLSDLLLELGFVVEHVNSGQAALDRLQQPDAGQAAYSFVLMDWLMPGMDGLQTAQAIQLLSLPAKPRVMMLSAHRREELIKGAEALGIAHVLAKPVNGSMLVNTMMQMLAPQQDVPQVRDLRQQQGRYEAQLERIGGARILLVEDNEINQQVACEILRLAGFEVDVADNGQIAVNQVQARFAELRPYDVVLMDMQMPVMDGVTAARLIRETHSADQLPIVAMTANAMKVDRERCRDAGMNGFVTKPIDPEELWKALLTLVKVREGMGGAVPLHAAEPAPVNDDSTILMQSLRAIRELDVGLGLSRTTNNPAFYASMLRKFVAAQEDAPARVQQAMDDHDVATAERIAHTLKGVAGNLGASELQTMAAQLEAALRTAVPVPELTRAMDDTASALQRLVQQLKAAPGLVPSTGPERAAVLTEADRDAARLVVAQIKQMLEEDDASALDLWESHARVLRAVYPDAQKIEAAIAGFAFDEAMQMLT